MRFIDMTPKQKEKTVLQFMLDKYTTKKGTLGHFSFFDIYIYNDENTVKVTGYRVNNKIVAFRNTFIFYFIEIDSYLTEKFKDKLEKQLDNKNKIDVRNKI